MKVLIVGLPYFAERLKNDLTEFDSENKYFFLNTYYNKWDRLKALFIIPRVDVVYSINGTLSNSKVFDIAFKRNKKVMMTWVGTDVLKAKQEKNINQLFLKKTNHFCEVNWIQEELKELEIDAKVLNFFNFKESKKQSFVKSERLQILSYISKNREEYYGWSSIMETARNTPSVDFTIVGTDIIENIPPNVKCLGWVEDMEPMFENCHCTIRFVKHDGLSGFVLESLFRGKHVIYSEPLHHCLNVSNANDMIDKVNWLEKEFKEGRLLINEPGVDFVKTNFSQTYILNRLIEEFKK